ncbi:NmrA family NAD(P)-binding protein [Mucilaginibacter aquaedulcis]|uniref:NmrA family NAD(P)-binding protein n=1 Tax=Mucilaginibacter aquaedulcis TaxID=1187081 RepID=UPI0025B44211|nr:NmrA family NAD(P)-binding protein [Mucilaginibacter aquaedulcis]MDN3548854.1 NmrA family NAD(P)-binding protein [Mucilaginibacter aquaedulcis]
METKVLVTGGTGPSGSNAIKSLLELQIPVRAMVRKLDDRSAALSAQGVEVVIGDMNDFNSVSAAMKGVNRAFFVYPVQAGLIQATSYFAQAALEEKLELVVNISQRTSTRNVPSKSAQDHWIAERLLDRSGVPVTHLQPTLFMEWLAYFAQEIKENNRFISPFGEARYGAINSEDIGRVGAAILAKPEGHAGKTYRIYGPEELTGQQIATIISDVLQKDIAFIPVEPEALGEIIGASDSPFNTPYTIQHIVAIGHMFRTGEFEGMNNNVEELSGRKPLAIADFVRNNIGMFQ